jgi:hypothetical protein
MADKAGIERANEKRTFWKVVGALGTVAVAALSVVTLGRIRGK